MSYSMSKSGDFPQTESKAGEFPKMEVKPLDFIKMESFECREKELFDFSKIQVRGFLERRQDTFLGAKTHTGFFHKRESSCGSGTSTLTTLESTISGISSRKRLMRKRDLMSLLLSYPLVITDDSGVSDLKRELYYERPVLLRYVEGLIPMEIIRDVEKGERSWSISTDGDLIPEAILNLAADLAVHQLIQTLLSISKHQYPNHIKYIRLSTRSGVEKRAVTAKIEAALNVNDEHHVPGILNSFCGTLSIDASTYPNPTAGAENQFGRLACQQLQLPMIEDDDILCTRRIEEEMSSNRYIVLLVDRDGEEIVDPQKLGFRKTQLSGVLVLITTESTTQPQAKDEELIAELMDLEIRTNDHLLPWEVFCHNVGKEVVYSSSAILTAAARIVEECRGHLLTILLVAKWLLRNLQDVKNWELALHKMQHANPSHATNKFRGLNRVMINTFLNLIWDGINMIQKHCLLRCLSIPEIRDGKVDCELMNDWISSLFLDAEETEQNLRQLLDNSVLLPFEDIGGRYIRLPDETYKILQLLYILNPLVLNGSGQGLTEPPEVDLWHNASRVQLADNKLSELPLSPNCLGLKVLMLQSNADLTKIPSSFFVHMPLLRILDLSYTSVRELPRSFFFLEQLRELYLKGCECFMKLPPEIGNLLKLEKLDLDETQITHLPKEVQKLTNMQSLTLYFYEYRGKKNMQYSCSTIIPSGVISNLKRLKHLSIGVNPDDERWHENVQVILPEILGLEFLQTLRIYIPQLELLKLIPAHIFEVDFRFIVGCHMQRIISSIPPAVDVKFNQSDCSLKFVKGDGVPAEIKKLLRYSKALFLDRHITLKNLSEFEMKNLEQLRLCILAECKEMQTIVGGGDSNGNDDMLSHLLFLSVSHMKNLRSIWEGPTPPRSLFGMLQSLSLQSCPELMTLFSLDFLGNLSLLKELVVKDCPKLSALISRESSKRNVDTFLPKLRKLSLLHLPELTSISSGLHIGPGLKEIGFYGCPKLCSLSRNELSSQQLTVIKGEAKWWKALKDRPSDWIFSPIHEEADVMTQLGIYNDDDIDSGPGGSVGKPSLSTGAASPISNSPALSGNSMVKEQRDPVEEANGLAKKPRFRCTIGLHDLFVDAVERLVGPARVAVEAEGVVAFVRVGMEERYEILKDLGSGNFGVAKLAKDKKTGELVAVKYIERGEKIDENVQREIINHRSLRHPNVIRFKEVLLTPTHLAIVLEYAAGGALFERVCNAGRFSEDEARFFFQQLVSGVSYCHSMQICHRDLKLENTLLDGNPAPQLKICDFGFSKSALLHSQPKSTVGTPAYIAPEVLSRKEYDGKIADVWSCGVTLYVMLVGAYPFEDPEDPRNFRKTIQRILSVQYSVPKYVRVSAVCRHLLSRIFVANPAKRITLPEIKQHPWFLKNLPSAIIEADIKSYEDAQKDQPSQSVEEIMRIIQEARKPGPGPKAGGQAGAGSLDYEDVEADELVDSSGEFVVAF